jgi:hypothetical protein
LQVTNGIGCEAQPSPRLAGWGVCGSAFGSGLLEQRGGELPRLTRRQGSLDSVLAARYVANVEADTPEEQSILGLWHVASESAR